MDGEKVNLKGKNLLYSSGFFKISTVKSTICMLFILNLEFSEICKHVQVVGTIAITLLTIRSQ